MCVVTVRGGGGMELGYTYVVIVVKGGMEKGTRKGAIVCLSVAC